MNKFLRTYLPAFSMAFTFIILYATISNIIAGYSKDRFCFFILQVFVYLMGKWFAFSAINITWYSCVYILIMIAIHCYFYHISKRQADEINNFLKLRNKR